MKKSDIKDGVCFCHKGDCYKISQSSQQERIYLLSGTGCSEEIVATVELTTQRSIHVYKSWMGERVERCIPFTEMAILTDYQFQQNDPFALPAEN